VNAYSSGNPCIDQKHPWALGLVEKAETAITANTFVSWIVPKSPPQTPAPFSKKLRSGLAGYSTTRLYLRSGDSMLWKSYSFCWPKNLLA